VVTRARDQNAGRDGSVVVDKVRAGGGNFGYNAASDQYEDLVQSGVIDPTKVVRSALQHTASVAGLILTTECAIAEKPRTEKAEGAGSPGMHG
jgi:chaperonin GroEL